MKPLHTLAFVPFIFACSSDQTTGDAGPDASNDATTNDGSASDSSSDVVTNDVVTDAPSSDGGGLGQGDSCDPKNDQCMTGLKCCPGGVILQDGGGDKCLQTTDAGTCPIVP